MIKSKSRMRQGKNCANCFSDGKLDERMVELEVAEAEKRSHD